MRDQQRIACENTRLYYTSSHSSGSGCGGGVVVYLFEKDTKRYRKRGRSMPSDFATA